MKAVICLFTFCFALWGCSRGVPPLLLERVVVYSGEEQSDFSPDSVTLAYDEGYRLVKYEAVGYEYYLLLDSIIYDNYSRIVAFRESGDNENPYGGNLSVKRVLYPNDTTVILLSSHNLNDQDRRYDDGKLKIDTVRFVVNADMQPVKRIEYKMRRKKRVMNTVDYIYVNGDYVDPEKKIIPRCLNPYRLAGDNLMWALLMDDPSMGNLHYWENSQCSEIELEFFTELTRAGNDLQYPSVCMLRNCNDTYYKTMFEYSRISK